MHTFPQKLVVKQQLSPASKHSYLRVLTSLYPEHAINKP